MQKFSKETLKKYICAVLNKPADLLIAFLDMTFFERENFSCFSKKNLNIFFWIFLTGLLIFRMSFNNPGKKLKQVGTKTRKTTTLVKALKDRYDADPLSMFSGDLPGVYKKKIQIDREIRNAMVLMPPKRVEKLVYIPPDSYLQFGFGCWERSFKARGDGLELRLFLNGKKVLSKYINPKKNKREQKWFDTKVDLRDYADQKITIAFEVSGSYEITPPFKRKPDNRGDYAAISDPVIRQYNPPVSTAKNVILISIDTLRADHLRCYGYKRKDISPNVDKLAEKGILFEKAFSPAPWTAPAHMSIFTSLLPSYHKVTGFSPTKESSFFSLLKKNVKFYYAMQEASYRILPENITTFPEMFRENGYATAAFTGGVWVDGRLGFCKGFDSYGSKHDFTKKHYFHKLKKWLRGNKRKKFFLFLHTYRVHAPYKSYVYAKGVIPDPVIENLKNANKHMQAEEFRKLLVKNGVFNRRVTEMLYDGGIKETDEYIGKLISTLENLKVLNNTIIVFLSDHGDEFAGHNKDRFYCGHGQTLYDDVLHVPLVFFVPGFEGKMRIKQQVRLIDVMPTVLDLAKIDYDSSKLQGVSLVPMMQGKKSEKELVAIAETCQWKFNEKKSIRTENAKYIYTVDLKKETSLADPYKEELYDLTYDPGELQNLHEREPELSEALKSKLNKTLVKGLEIKTKKRKIDKDMKKSLKALGYLQ